MEVGSSSGPDRAAGMERLMAKFNGDDVLF